MQKPHLIILTLSSLLAACSTGQPQTPIPTTIDAFGANPNPSPVNVAAQFSWTVFGQDLTCRLDAEGDGITDYTVQGCTSQSRVVHRYGAPGTYTAQLTASGADGQIVQRTTPVVTTAPNTSPVILLLPPTTVPNSTNDLEVSFGWTVADPDADVTHCRFDADSDGVWEFDNLCSGLPASSSVGKASSASHTYRHKYNRPGQYEAVLEANDSYTTTQTRVKVRLPYNRAPIVENLTAERGAGLYITINFKVSDPDLDTLGCTLTIQRLGTFRYPNCSEHRRVYQLPQSGKFAVTLEVTDPLQAGDTRRTTAEVYAEGWMAGGHKATCSLDNTGKAWCWGANQSGQVGIGANGGEYPSATAVAATPSGTAFTMISMAVYYDSQHVCGLRDNGTLWCWGFNAQGQTGSKDTDNHGSPVQAHPGHRYTSVAAGTYHTCATHDDGTAWCWGKGDEGQLGNGTTTASSLLPVQVLGGGRYTTVVAGNQFTCGLRTDGTAWCWGRNGFGQLGSPGSSSSVPRQVSSGHRYTTLSAGRDNACALRADGTAWCWGHSAVGQLGTGFGAPDAYQPVAVLGKIDFVSISAGFSHTCGVDRDGAAWCWGRNLEGALGLGNNDSATYYQPVRVDSTNLPGKGFKAIEVGRLRTFGLRDDNSLWAWGNNTGSALGVGQPGYPLTYSPIPMRVDFP